MEPANGTPGLDGRMWEMVSPPDKAGASIEALPAGGAAVQASADGEKMAYVSSGPVGEVEGNRTIEVTQLLSSRGADGWSSLALTTPSEELTNLVPEDISEYKLFSSDGGLGVVEPKAQTPLPPLQAGAEQTIYLRNTANGEYTPLVTKENVVPGASFGGSINFLGGTPDLSHVIVGSTDGLTAAEGLTPAALPTSEGQLYEWAAGKLRLVSVSPGRTAVAGALGSRDVNVRHAISNDGDRVVWQQEKVGVETPLNLRDMAREETVRIDTTQPGASGPSPDDFSEEALFQTASSDGSRVFFTDESELTTSSHAQPYNSDLYVFEAPRAGALSAGTLTDLTVPLHAGESAGVRGAVLGAGEEGTSVYFVANGVLAPGPAEPGHCEEGARESGSTAVCYLYVARYDTVSKTWHTTYIATLTNADEASWDPEWPEGLLGLTAEVSPNGRYVAFMSTRSLTGYDNRDASSGASDLEVFVYDAEDGQLACASCNPMGAQPHGVFDEPDSKTPPLYDRSGDWLNQWVAGSIPGWTSLGKRSTYYQPRYISDEGRLFFDSSDALVPAATNQRVDVYEYEPQGVGPETARCGPGVDGVSDVFKPEREVQPGVVEGAGCVGLISSGTSNQESVLMDSSESGNDVFFLTAASLAPEDKDSAFDVYDARICEPENGNPCISPQTPELPCESTLSCRAPSTGTLLFATPSSATLSGQGNLSPPPLPPAVKTKTLGGRAHNRLKLANALKACRKKPKKRRAVCEKQARKKYGAAKAKKSAKGRK